MTTNPEQGKRQFEEQKQQEQIRVGDKVRLRAGGEYQREMTVVEMGDYGKQLICEYTERAMFSARSLVKVG
jgi:preprotein translocase subunit YajC